MCEDLLGLAGAHVGVAFSEKLYLHELGFASGVWRFIIMLLELLR